MDTVYIAVHGGAGYHSQASERKVKHALRNACRQALQAAAANDSAQRHRVVEAAIAVLEDEECLNAGYGSNLTIDGTVECDAAIMDGMSGDFGSVGATSGVKNPIYLASAVLQKSRRPDRIGRIHPMTLVSTGAHSFAVSIGLETVPTESMISPQARENWQRWTSRLHGASEEDYIDNNRGQYLAEDSTLSLESTMQDTVGAVAFVDGNLAAGVSSGGLLLKHSGRIGEAAVFGAGCWAHQSHSAGMACSVSGAGEHIVRAALARTIGEFFSQNDTAPAVDAHEILHRVLVDLFCNSMKSRDPDLESNAGVLLLTKETGDNGEITPRLWCAFTSESMAIGYASSAHPSPKALILRRPTISRTDKSNAPQIYITALPF